MRLVYRLETGEGYYNDMFRSRGPECTRISNGEGGIVFDGEGVNNSIQLDGNILFTAVWEAMETR